MPQQLAIAPSSTSSVEDWPTRARSMAPRPYQITGIRFLHESKRSIIGDAPGLGKTFQACEAAELPACVCCPLSLVEQWVEFIHDQYPSDIINVAAYGSPLERAAALLTPAHWYIINHDFLRKSAKYSKYAQNNMSAKKLQRHNDNYMPPPPVNTLIIDEFHHFRNHDASRSNGLREYAKRTPRVYGLTATPIYKDVGDLWHLLHVIDSERWSSYYSFLFRHAVTMDYGYGTQVVRIKNYEALEHDVAPVLLARTYKDVGLFLPDRIDKQIVLRPNPDFMKSYRLLRDQYKQEMKEGDTKRFFNAGAVLHALRAMTVTPEKIDAVKEIIDETPGTEPIIVFCWYRATGTLLAEALDAALITGEIDPEERRALARNSPKRVRVCTMESLSEGVDLSDSRTVIYVEESYVPGQKYQSLSRVQRFRTASDTDDSPIIAYWVRYRDTVDDTVHRTALRRTTGNAMTVLKEALGDDDE